MIHFTN